MGARKHNPTTITTVGAGRFPSSFISECEADRCASFAIALSRLTHWPVEAIELVDELPVPYRFLCSDNAGEWSFDVTGVFRGARVTDLVRRVTKEALDELTKKAFSYSIDQTLKSSQRCPVK